MSKSSYELRLLSCRARRRAGFRYNRRSIPATLETTTFRYCILIHGGTVAIEGPPAFREKMADEPVDPTRRSEPLRPAPGAGEPASAGAASLSQPPVDQVYVEHAPLLRRVACRKFGIPPADAESLVHDVFICYLSDPRRVRTNLRAYLIAAICNASRKYWASRQSEARVFSDDVLVDDVVVEEAFDGLDTTLLVAATLARLPARYRDILRRHYLEGQDTKTIASALDTTPTNVNYLMHVCRIRAREIYHELNRRP